jgi:hypothetical protein
MPDILKTNAFRTCRPTLPASVWDAVARLTRLDHRAWITGKYLVPVRSQPTMPNRLLALSLDEWWRHRPLTDVVSLTVAFGLLARPVRGPCRVFRRRDGRRGWEEFERDEGEDQHRE